MKKIREILRLKFALGRTHREIALSCSLSPSTVGECVARCKREGLSWPLSDALTDEKLEKLVYRVEPCKTDQRPLPDWDLVHRELRRRDCHVSLHLLWEEYRRQHPDGYEYSWFCGSYREWKADIEPVMRKQHRSGYATYVDYAGDTIPIVGASGETRRAQVFVAVLGASNYTYCEATWSQNLTSWIESHIRMFEFFGGVTEVLVPDNLKSGVTKACFYDPQLNPTYRELAHHYGVAVLPTRTRKPKDKAKVEGAVLVAERWIIAQLRHRSFYSLDEVNEAIQVLLKQLNERPFQKLPGSRAQSYRDLDQPCLKALPATRFEVARWKRATVHLDYHVQVEGSYYSVPHQLVREAVEVRLTGSTVEVLHGGQRVACHLRSLVAGKTTTVVEHMPSNHREVSRWSPETMLLRARRIGPGVEALVLGLLERKQHPEQAVRGCLGVFTLGKKHGNIQLEDACRTAVERGAFRYQSVKNLLGRQKQGSQQKSKPSGSAVTEHENVRGESYYRELAQHAR